MNESVTHPNAALHGPLEISVANSSFYSSAFHLQNPNPSSLWNLAEEMSTLEIEAREYALLLPIYNARILRS